MAMPLSAEFKPLCNGFVSGKPLSIVSCNGGINALNGSNVSNISL